MSIGLTEERLSTPQRQRLSVASMAKVERKVAEGRPAGDVIWHESSEYLDHDRPRYLGTCSRCHAVVYPSHLAECLGHPAMTPEDRAQWNAEAAIRREAMRPILEERDARDAEISAKLTADRRRRQVEAAADTRRRKREAADATSGSA